jgi:ABC-type glycerol-3-phosphate transport system substrate-binding protein
VAALLKDKAQDWESRTGGHVIITLCDPTQGPMPDADAWIFTPAEMPGYAAAGRLQRVPESLTTRDAYAWNKLLEIYKKKLLTWDGVPFAVPLAGEAPLVFYRTDLFALAEKQRNRKLAPPATWEEYLDLAELFDAQPALGIPGRSLPPLPENDDELDREFFSIAVSTARRVLKDSDADPPEAEMFSFHFDLPTMTPRIAGPGFVDALGLMQRLHKCRAPGSTAHPPEAFARGEAVLCLAEARWIEVFQKGKVGNHFGIARVPGSRVVYGYTEGPPRNVADPNFVPYLGASGWLAAVPKTSARAEAAWDLLAELTGPETSRQIVINPQWGGGATRGDHFENVNSWDYFRLPHQQTADLVKHLNQQVVHLGIKNPVLRLRIPGQREYEKALLEEVRQALLHGKSAEAALTAAAEKWRQLGSREELKARQRDYYLSLSIEPPR